MPLVEISNEKGLVQKTGSGFVAVPKDLQTLTGNDQTIDTSGFYVRVDPTGARTGTILEKGLEDGQLLLLSNVGAGGETITFAVEATSFFKLGAVALDPGESMLCVWDATLVRWLSTTQTLA
jgi:hypothetical protein